MQDRLELPDELISLIEKRESGDRRQADSGEAPPPSSGERRTGGDRRDAARQDDAPQNG